MNIILTGATGYVGSNLITALLNLGGHNLFAITRNSSTIPAGVTVIYDNSNMEENIIAARPDIVVHLASYLTSKAELEDIDKLINSNILFGTRILNALNKTRIKSFINVGSFAEYHHNDGTLNPTYLYSATKTAFRPILQYYSEINNFKVIHVIPYSIYGGVDRQKKVLDILFDAIGSKEPLKMSLGYQYLDFVHIHDVVDFFLILIKQSYKVNHNEELYLGSGKPHNLREISAIIEQISKQKVNVDWGSNPPRERDTLYACAAIGKIKQLFDWLPAISIEDGMRLKFKGL